MILSNTSRRHATGSGGSGWMRSPTGSSSVTSRSSDMDVDATHIRVLLPADADAYRELRLRALREHPEAFSSSFEEALADAARWSADRLGASPEQATILGAVTRDGVLCGIVGVERLPRAKERHKAHLYGMYVAPEQAGQGIGRRLLEAAVARCLDWRGVEQIQLSVTGGNER